MYSVKVRDHIMIAHSLPDPFFGPAQGMHGATYVVDVTFFSSKLNDKNVVIDIGLANKVLQEVLGKLNYQNLDHLSEMQGTITTTEYLSQYIHEKVKSRVGNSFEGKIRVTLGESHVAWASFEA